MNEIVQVELINSGLGLSDYLAIASVIGAWVTVGISLKSIKQASKNIELLLKQEDRNMPKLNATSKNSFFYVDAEKAVRVYCFYLEISNLSDSSNSVSNCDLSIIFNADDREQQMAFKCKKEINVLENVVSVGLPISISHRSTEKFWIAYEVPLEVIQNLEIDKYEIRLTDTFKNKISEEIIMIEKVQ